MSDNIHLGINALAANGGEMHVRYYYYGGFVEIRVENPSGHAVIRFEPDDAKRFFRLIHEKLGDP
jgi:hypothetical protein